MNCFAVPRTWPVARRSSEGIFDALHPADELARLEARAAAPDFWKDQADAQRVLQRRRRLEQDREAIEDLRRREADLSVLVEWAQQSEDVGAELAQSLDSLAAAVDVAETKKMLGGEHDQKNAIVTIHPGAGGTESQDWAEMLLRMYLRWCEKKGFSTQIIDSLQGDEAGIKSVTVMVTGEYAYGYLRAEIGVHRLVRLSPFDANHRRHTSFASLFAFPDIDDDVVVEINEADLRIDTFRSGGPGGQHVNTTDSAVRITHLPTSIVAQCQNERSQHKNKEMAMKVLRARLYEYELGKKNEELAKIRGVKRDIAFGSQIRSYVFHPYRMIKDLRTDVEVGDVDRVMNGDLDGFIEAYLKSQQSRE